MASLNSNSITGITTTIFDDSTIAINKNYADNNIPTVPSAAGQKDKVLVSVDGTNLVWREISSSFEYTTTGTHTFNVPDISTLFYVEAMSGGEGGGGALNGTTEPTEWSRRTIPNSYYPYGPYAFGYDTSGNGLHAFAGKSSDYVQFSTDLIVWTLRTFYQQSGPWVAYANNLWFGGGYERLHTSTDSINWTMRTVGGVQSYGGAVTDVMWDGSYYIIVGGESSSPRMNASTDAIHWVMRTGPDSSHAQYYRNIQKHGNTYVLVTGSGYVATSTDGIAWTKRTSPYHGAVGSNTNFKGLNYGESTPGGTSVWVSPYANYLRVSTDAIHWALRTAGFTSYLYDSATNGIGIWTLVGNSGYRATSTDTIHWTRRTGNDSDLNSREFYAAGYGGGLWSWYCSQNSLESAKNLGPGAGGAGGNYASWYIQKNLVTSNTMTIQVGSGGAGGTIADAADGNNAGAGTTISWTGPGGSMSVTSKGGSGVTQEDDIFYYSPGSASSTNQSKFNQATGGGAGAFGSGNGDSGGQVNYLGISTFATSGQDAPKTIGFPFGPGGGGGKLISPVPYPAWTLRTTGHQDSSGNLAPIFGVGYAYGQWLAAGQYNAYSTSTDTIHWTRRTTGYGGGNFNFNFAYDGNNTLALGSENGRVATSTDAIHFTKRTMGVPKSSSNVYALSYLNNYFLSGHQNAQLQVSTDAIHWTLRTSGGDSNKDIQSFAYGAGKYLYGNQSGQIATSTDTIHWTQRTIGATTTNIRGLIYANSQYIAAGYGARISTSTDAIHWTTRTAGLPSGAYLGEVNYSNNLYHIVQANGGRIVSSTDSIHWTLRTSNAGSGYFSGYPNGLINNGKEYIAGGLSGLLSYLKINDSIDGGKGFRGGGGGGGACSSDGSTTSLGGDGGDGYVKITWY